MRYPKSIARFLPVENEPAIAKALKIKELESLCKQFLPPTLARHTHAANLKDGSLVVLADNPAAAAKLKLYAESLGEFLAKRRPEVSSVSVRVQPAAQTAQPPKIGKTRILSEEAVRGLTELHEQLSDSPARQALTSLLKHHGRETPRSKAGPPDPQE